MASVQWPEWGTKDGFRRQGRTTVVGFESGPCLESRFVAQGPAIDRPRLSKGFRSTRHYLRVRARQALFHGVDLERE